MIDLESLREIEPASDSELAAIRSRLETQRPAFISDEAYLAIFAFGGTIQSAYVPNAENIIPVSMNPALERTAELSERFGIAGKEMTGAILIARDSREVTDADIVMLIHTIQTISNKNVLVTCGTYMLPQIAQALDMHFGDGKSNKIIGITGSSLPGSQFGQDADYNIGGAIAATNALKKINSRGIVFAQFHGEIFTGAELATLNLHPPEAKPRFARAYVDVR